MSVGRPKATQAAPEGAARDAAEAEATPLPNASCRGPGARATDWAMLPLTATTGGAKATQAASEDAARDATQTDAGDNVKQGCNDADGCW